MVCNESAPELEEVFLHAELGHNTGGIWGIEASYISICINFLIGLFIFKTAIDKGQLVLRKWKRKKVESPTEIEVNPKSQELSDK